MKKFFLNAAKPARGFERDVSFDCLSCGSVIVHPLCAHCIGRDFLVWARESVSNSSMLCGKVRGFLASHRLFDGKGVRCVSCNTKRASLCPSCFSELLYTFVREEGVGIRKLSEFLFLFNFDFDHSGSSVELEFFGGY